MYFALFGKILGSSLVQVVDLMIDNQVLLKGKKTIAWIDETWRIDRF